MRTAAGSGWGSPRRWPCAGARVRPGARGGEPCRDGAADPWFVSGVLKLFEPRHGPPQVVVASPSGEGSAHRVRAGSHERGSHRDTRRDDQHQSQAERSGCEMPEPPGTLVTAPYGPSGADDLVAFAVIGAEAPWNSEVSGCCTAPAIVRQHGYRRLSFPLEPEPRSHLGRPFAAATPCSDARTVPYEEVTAVADVACLRVTKVESWA